MFRAAPAEAASRPSGGLPPAVAAFDAIAGEYDQRFGGWASVAAQRRAVRRELLRAFAPDNHLLELGGGTGEDALYMAEQGRHVFLTDGAPAMVAKALEKAQRAGQADRIRGEPKTIEDLEVFALERAAKSLPMFDGAYSNFAALNCVADLRAVGRGLGRLLRPGARAALVVFGPLPPGEVVVQLLRGHAGAAFRRLGRGDSPARLAGRNFSVRYPAPGRIAQAFAPYFQLVRTRGIGIFVPPSAAEPEISRFPRLLAVLRG